MNAAPGVVLLTGATGFLGSTLARRLRASGHELHCSARASSDRSVLAGVEATWHAGDLTDADSLRAAALSAARSARATGRVLRFVHCGALISYKTRDAAAQRLVNVEGTRHALAAARDAGAARFLHVSSVVAVGHSEGGVVLDENAPWNNAHLGCDYATTKHAAEQLALAEPDLDVVVVNPGAIFGTFQHGSNTARFIRLVASGRCPIVAPPGSLSVLGIDDAAAGCELALERGRRGERYLLVESWLTAFDLFQAIARTTRARGPRAVLPRALWGAVPALCRLVERARPQMLTPPQALVMLGVDLRFHARKARDELGWRPRPFADILRETVESLLGARASEAGPARAERADGSRMR